MQLEPIKVNGSTIHEGEIFSEMIHHQHTSHPWRMAVRALIEKRLLLEEAQRLGLQAATEDELYHLLLAAQRPLPELTDEASRQYYEQNKSQFSVGASAEVNHILFQANTPIEQEALRPKAQVVLEQALVEPSLFSQLALQHSNCPSAEKGGALGVLTRGQTVPEFDAVVFQLDAGQIHPELIKTQFGWHIIQVMAKDDGEHLSYEEVVDSIHELLQKEQEQVARKKYTEMLVLKADIEGFDY